MTNTQEPRRRVMLVGIQLPRISDQAVQESLRELGRLVDTLGYDVVGSLTQRRPNLFGATILGEGKLKELARTTGGTGVVQSMVQVKKTKAAEKFDKKAEDENDDDFESLHESSDEPSESGADFEVEDDGESTDDSAGATIHADVIVFDCELSPSQLRNLESATGAQVLDRTGVIIEIFSRHARTRAAQLQVEIARLNYMAPRIRETGGGADRQGGGIGAKGAGETSIELDRRRIRDRVKELKVELEAVQHEHSVRRSRRSSEHAVALVGYTNAGKSSLMRAMTASDVYIADRLFATLDTTVRPIFPETTPRILLSDTVGFIKQLPHDLVASFKSTLDEASNADLLLFVVDASDFTFREQLKVTQTVLSEIGVVDTPSRIVLNKRDRLTDTQMAELRVEFPEAMIMSTRIADDLAALREVLVSFFESGMSEAVVVIPYTVQGAIGELRAQMRVVSEAFDETGVRFVVRARPENLQRLASRFEIEVKVTKPAPTLE